MRDSNERHGCPDFFSNVFAAFDSDELDLLNDYRARLVYAESFDDVLPPRSIGRNGSN